MNFARFLPNRPPAISLSRRYFFCGCCESYHAWEFDGDCRQDDARHHAEDLDELHGEHGWTEINHPDLEDDE